MKLILVSFYWSGVAERHLFHKESNAQECFRRLATEHNMLPEIVPESFEQFVEDVCGWNEMTSREIIYEELVPEDLADKDNDPPTLVDNDPATDGRTLEYKGVKFKAASNKERMEFQNFIDQDLNGNNRTPKIRCLYRHHGWFYFQDQESDLMQVTYENGRKSYVCSSHERMHKFIDRYDKD
jgi:hypothetical protein